MLEQSRLGPGAGGWAAGGTTGQPPATSWRAATLAAAEALTGSWTGGVLGPLARCVLAPNPGPLTLDGTNTWVLSAPGSATALVVDPGPDDEGHLAAVLAAVRERGADVGAVLLTHGHPDHAAGARRFAQLSGAGVQALDPGHCLGTEGLVDGDVIAAGELELRVVATPGHSADSLCFLLPGAAGLLTGDTVLGRGTTVVALPDGDLADYLASLEVLQTVCADADPAVVLPGHGPALSHPADVVRSYRRHRRVRLEQVAAAVAEGARTPRAVVERVYADVDRAVWPAAELSVRAQLEYLGRSIGG